MISIVISSYKTKLYERLAQNIACTIGVTYELIKIDNPGIFSIAEAYNKGGEKAVYPIILFIHEDILFRSSDWGKALINRFLNPRVGLIGLAGCKVKSITPSGWFIAMPDFCYYNLIQNSSEENAPHKICNIEGAEEVAVIDGFFMATRKEVFLENRFDETLIRGYHAYDLDISLAIGARFQVIVIDNILVEHFSGGRPDENWYNTINLVNEKYAYRLPASTESISASVMHNIEYVALRDYLKNTVKYRGVIVAINYLSRLHMFKLLGFKRYLMAYVYIFYVIVTAGLRKK